MELKKMTFMQACRDYFGLQQGQTAMDFMKEIKALSDKDREDLTEEFKKVGLQVLPAGYNP